jgi:hypothetical protein
LFNYKYESISWRLLNELQKIAKDRKVIPDPIDEFIEGKNGKRQER